MARDRTPRRKGRPVDYVHLTHPFTPQPVFSEDAIAALHEAALGLLEQHGMKILLPEARALFAAAGARGMGDMVFIGRDIIANALTTAPRQWRMRSMNSARERQYAPGQLLFGPGAGCPNATDLVRGRRPGTLRDYLETLALQQSFDVIHILGPSVEPQDVAAPLRPYAMMQAQICRADKPMFVYARGRAQVQDSLHMIRLGLGLTEDEWASGVWAYTVINTNSPRQLDNPMAQGIIDFARAGQASIITPFCLAGAMAPVTVAGALILQHAEALAGITLAQLARPGAPVSYGGFSSNVDMKSGAPAFGTPEYMRATQMTGQLVRYYKLPLRSSGVCAANVPDGQAMWETSNSLWAAVQSRTNMVYHAAGWLEGGLIASPEKFIMDCEVLQMIQRYFEEATFATTEEDIAIDAIREVGPGGHYFGCQHTQDRYQTAFYAPMISDWRNYEAWQMDGAQWTTERAHRVYKQIMAEFEAPAMNGDHREELRQFVARRKQEGGAPTDF